MGGLRVKRADAGGVLITFNNTDGPPVNLKPQSFPFRRAHLRT